MSFRLTPLAGLALALAACGSPEPAAVDPAEPAPDTTASITTPTVAADPELMPPDAPVSSDQAPGFDMRGFAGTFTGTLPCASCPGIDITLQLDPDGRYRLTEAYQEEAGPAVETEGSWSVEDGDSRMRLDPAGKEAGDRLLAIESNERVEFLALDGEPAESGLDYGLERQAQ